MAETGILQGRLAIRWLIGGEWRSHPARFLATAVAIAVGVALGFAVHLINGSALSAFDGAVRGVNGAADLQVRGATALGFDERAYPRVATAPGVADASPVVRLTARIGAIRFDLLGLDAIRAANVTPGLIGIGTPGLESDRDSAFASDRLFASRALIAALDTRIGARIAVAANGRTARFTIAGTLPGAGDGRMIGVIDIAAAQWRFARLGRVDRIDLKLADRAAAERALPPLLPSGAVIGSADAQANQGAALSRAYRVNLDMLALVALLTGGFLVFSAQSLSVARRSRAFALVRTLGLPRGGIVAAVALEGLAIGVLGAIVGLGIGYGLASVALRMFGGDLGAGYFQGEHATIVFQWGAAAGFFALGTAAALLGSVLPARIAARVAPAAALKASGDPIDPRVRVPWRPAAVLIAIGAALAFLPAIGGLPILGFASMAFLLAGGVAGVPRLARMLLGGAARATMRGVALPLAVRHIHGAPGEAATALCGIVASTALMIAMATMVTSFRGAVDEWLGDVLSSDLYVRSVGGAGFDRVTQARLAQVPGIAEITFSRELPLTLVPDRPGIALIVRAVDPRAPGATLTLLSRTTARPAGTIPIWVSEPASRLYGWTDGDIVSLPIARGRRFAVMGVWRDYARQQGAIVLRDRDYTALTGDERRDQAAIILDPGADGARVGRALTAALPPADRETLSIASPATLRRFALQLFDRSFAVTYVLEAVAILVGLAGVAATMSAQTIARTREFGMLRHLGVAKRQVTAMLAIEGGLLGAVGAVAGVMLGGVLSQVLIHVINPQSFNWTMATRVPWATVAGVTATLIAAAAGTAVLAGRRATARSAVLAVREDW